MNKPTGREIAGKYVFAVILIVVMICIIIVSVWSFEQTQKFLSVFDDAEIGFPLISFAFAVIFQYGQNPALWWGSIELAKAAYYERLIARYNSPDMKGNPSNAQKLLIAEQGLMSARRNAVLSFGIFGVFSLVDAGTNIGQFNSTNLNMPPLAWGLGNIVCVAIVFIEEFFMKVLNMFFHTVNDIRVSHGFPRWSSLDAFNPGLFSSVSGGFSDDTTSESRPYRPGREGIGPRGEARSMGERQIGIFRESDR